MLQSITLTSQNRYEVRVYGQLGDSWLEWLEETDAKEDQTADETRVTTLSVVMDQAGLVGLIRKLHGLGIVLLSIRYVERAFPR